MQSENITKFILCLSFLLGVFAVSETRGATFVVTRTDDRNGATVNCLQGSATPDCSLREAVAAANAAVGADTIQFNSALTVTLTRNPATLILTGDVTINGGNSTVTRGVTPNARIFLINAGITATLNNLQISNGQASDVTGGGAIRNDGTLNVNFCTISGNRAFTSNGGGIANTVGATLFVSNSTITGNFANFGNGAGINNFGTATITDSTINDNQTTGNGGGIFNAGTANYANLTIYSNNAALDGGGIFQNGGVMRLNNATIAFNNSTNGNGGGIINNSGSTVYRNTLIAANTGPIAPDVSGAAFISLGNNLIGNATGSSAPFQPTDILNPPTPGIAFIANNGGATQTVALLAASPAVNAGNNCVTTASCASNNPPFALTNDQRGAGFPRQSGAAVDIGAFESSVVTAANVTIGGRVSDANGQAIARATVSLTDASGAIRFAVTSSFGFYRFEDVAAGETYIFSVRHKRFQFAPQVVFITEETANLDFTALP